MSEQLTLFDRESDYLESDINGFDKKSASFRVHASLIYKLGESLIADEVTALSELIKNAYDADATICMLSIDSNYTETIAETVCKGLIELSDNGCGMDLSTIINGWLTLSNSPKKKMKKEERTTPKYHRYPLGDKGLGRLSVQKLGRNMKMITKLATSKIEYTVTIPWGDFLKNTTIDQIPVKIEETEIDNEKSYTKIIIKDLIDDERWASQTQIDILTNSISKIVSPFRSKENTFKVVAKVNGQEIETIGKIFDELLASARAKHTIKYSCGKAEVITEYKRSFFYNREILQKIVSGEFTLSETAINDFLRINQKSLSNVFPRFDYGNILASEDECLFEDIQLLQKTSGDSLRTSDPGEFECEIYEYSLDQKYLDYLYENISYDRLIDRDEYRNFIKRFYGIKVVRDGFVVQGFGEGEGGDWLGLSSSSKTTGYFFDLRNDSIIGCVYLTGNCNAVLKETTNREGFVEDEYYHAFYKILDDSIKRINRNRKKLNDAMKAYVVEAISLSSDIGDNVLTFKPTIIKIREEMASTTPLISEGHKHIASALDNYSVAKRIIDSSPFVPSEVTKSLDNLYQNIADVSGDYKRIQQERDSLNKKLDAINYDFEKINERLQDLFELAGLGISVELFAHEFDSSIRSVKAKNQQVIDSKSTQSIDDLIKHINYVTYSLDALRKQMSYFNPGLKFVRAEKQVFNISDFLESHRSFYKERCEKKNIDFNVNVLRDFKVRINRGMLNQAFDNLFSNSEYWLDFSARKDLIKDKKYTIEVLERGIIVVWDNGIGVSKDIETRLFEPFESKKTDGRGLGLYIAASNLKYNSARIRLLGERNQERNLYKFEIDLSQLMQ
ncbi:sensor histidine kinase [Desulfosporosinus lacus]|uniref:Signal transduction histidine kinase n=1 Tax=Desulfosporosinus lacus DSM 15449 TaxID=1121420 RepID=A0A1M5V153_9FIRM|nr:sensor histidine kinase [Desulfosporosinus lacus]SHH68828.1 Signal transduction histidine kinase [Desulfosporosinus lacus DSM 15449]